MESETRLGFVPIKWSITYQKEDGIFLVENFRSLNGSYFVVPELCRVVGSSSGVVLGSTDEVYVAWSTRVVLWHGVLE